MIKFTETSDGYVFTNGDTACAIGVYEKDAFYLLHKEKMLPFGNAMQAFSHLRSIYEPKEPSEQTKLLFTTPARAIDNMSKYKDNVVLKDVPKEVFHANLPN